MWICDIFHDNCATLLTICCFVKISDQYWSKSSDSKWKLFFDYSKNHVFILIFILRNHSKSLWYVYFCLLLWTSYFLVLNLLHFLKSKFLPYKHESSNPWILLKVKPTNLISKNNSSKVTINITSQIFNKLMKCYWLFLLEKFLSSY